MSFINKNDIVIDLKIKKEYTLLHISDSHVIIANDHHAINNEEAWYKVKKDFAIHFNEPINSAHMIPSKDCFDKVMEYALNVCPNALILTGDIIDYYNEKNLNYVKNKLNDSKLKYLYSCGNHEEIIDIIKEFDVIEFNEFKIISINNSQKKINKNTLERLRKELNKPTILAMHIPLLSKHNKEEMKKYDEYFTMKYTDVENNDFFNLIEENSHIKAILCGHVHGKGESFVTPNIKQYCASSSLIGQVNLIKVK